MFLFVVTRVTGNNEILDIVGTITLTWHLLSSDSFHSSKLLAENIRREWNDVIYCESGSMITTIKLELTLLSILSLELLVNIVSYRVEFFSFENWVTGIKETFTRTSTSK